MQEESCIGCGVMEHSDDADQEIASLNRTVKHLQDANRCAMESIADYQATSDHLRAEIGSLLSQLDMAGIVPDDRHFTLE